MVGDDDGGRNKTALVESSRGRFMVVAYRTQFLARNIVGSFARSCNESFSFLFFFSCVCVPFFLRVTLSLRNLGTFCKREGGLPTHPPSAFLASFARDLVRSGISRFQELSIENGDTVGKKTDEKGAPRVSARRRRRRREARSLQFRSSDRHIGADEKHVS